MQVQAHDDGGTRYCTNFVCISFKLSLQPRDSSLHRRRRLVDVSYLKRLPSIGGQGVVSTMASTTAKEDTTGMASSRVVNNRKRKADSLGRIAEADSVGQSGRGALVGWTTCPLCGRHSRKRYALGRGIASHLHAVHTPWNPGKMERKKQRRTEERLLAEKHKSAKLDAADDRDDVTSSETPVVLKAWEPNQEEIDAWDERVLQIVKDLETPQDHHDDDDNVNRKELDKHEITSTVGFDRDGQPSQSYRKSLPPFIQAAADGNLTLLKEMVAEVQVSKTNDHHGDCRAAVWDLVDTRDRHLSTAEHWAAGGGHISCLKYLLSLRQKYASRSEKDSSGDGSNAKKTRRRDGKTCLHYSARNGHLECITFLVEEQGHSIDERSGDGTTPFHMACFGGHCKVAEFFLKQGANVHAVNDWGCSPAHWAGMTRSEDVAQVRQLCNLLQKAGVSFSERQKQGHSCAHKAAQKLNRSVIEWMAESSDLGGANLSTEEKQQAGMPDVGGHTPSEIWRSVGGEESFAQMMEKELFW
jgi:ankyrin repeat protein